jgi:hypothetical protein
MLTVTTAAEDPTLLTIAELRAAIDVPTGDDAVLDRLNRRVAAAICGVCRVAGAGATTPTLRLETLTEVFRLKSRHAELVLARRPIVEIVSAVEADETLTAADHESETSAGLLYRLDGSDNRSCWAAAKITIVYRAGWETVPDDLRGIAAELAQTFWAEKARGDSNLRSEEIPGLISRTWWVDNSDTSPIPEKLINALHVGGYVNLWMA